MQEPHVAAYAHASSLVIVDVVMLLRHPSEWNGLVRAAIV